MSYICHVKIENMLVRLESIKNSEQVLVIDEIGRFLGEIYGVEFFLICVLEDEDILEEDDYIFYRVDKECLNKLLWKK